MTIYVRPYVYVKTKYVSSAPRLPLPILLVWARDRDEHIHLDNIYLNTILLYGICIPYSNDSYIMRFVIPIFHGVEIREKNVQVSAIRRGGNLHRNQSHPKIQISTPKVNSSPEKGPVQKENNLQNIIFQGTCEFSGVYCLLLELWEI